MAKRPAAYYAPTIDPDEQLASTTGSAIQEFLKGLAAFFRTAKALEDGALETLTRAKALRPATSPDEDEALQRICKAITVDKREVEDHWKITATVSQFHRRMTARRAKATDALEEASALANGLHNRYVAEERRKAAEAQERLRREAEEQARRDREAELLEMERAAVAREEASPDLSGREQVFVDAVCAGHTPLQAAQRAGYKDPGATASRLLNLAKIATAIKAKLEAARIREQAAARKAAPITPAEVPTIKANVTRAGDAHDRTTLSAELLDPDALLTAFLGCKPADFQNRYGIPADLFEVNEARLNQYARSLGERINMWPGVRLKKSTKVV